MPRPVVLTGFGSNPEATQAYEEKKHDTFKAFASSALELVTAGISASQEERAKAVDSLATLAQSSREILGKAGLTAGKFAVVLSAAMTHYDTLEGSERTDDASQQSIAMAESFWDEAMATLLTSSEG